MLGPPEAAEPVASPPSGEMRTAEGESWQWEILAMAAATVPEKIF